MGCKRNFQKRCWKMTKVFQFVLKVRHVKKSTFESGIKFICGYLVFLREEFLSGNFKKQTLSSHSVKKPRESQPLLFYQIPRNVVFLKKKFLATSGSFWEGLCRTKCCLFVCCLLLEKPSCWVCKRVFAHVSKWLRKKARAINIYIPHKLFPK